jgi:hypothetical protein
MLNLSASEQSPQLAFTGAIMQRRGVSSPIRTIYQQAFFANNQNYYQN